MKDLLKQIEAGKADFGPIAEPDNEFKGLVKQLHEAFVLGYLLAYKPHWDQAASHKYVHSVYVGGLTAHGRRFLNRN